MMNNLLVQTKKFWTSVKPSTNAFTVQGSQNELTNSIFFGMQTEKNLNLTEQKACKGLLSKEECLKALKDMECNKTPSSVGLPAEFYNVFWNDISDLFLNSINYAYRSGQLSLSNST